jgi:hypothetical protein
MLSSGMWHRAAPVRIDVSAAVKTAYLTWCSLLGACLLIDTFDESKHCTRLLVTANIVSSMPILVTLMI